jgi:hypothetical protein
VRPRLIIPFLLVAVLTVLVIAAAVTGARSESDKASEGVPPNDPVAAGDLRSIIERTATALNFTEEVDLEGPGVPGPETLVYNAPDKVEIYVKRRTQSPIITIGSTQYILNVDGPGWAKSQVPTPEDGRKVAEEPLSALLDSRSVQATSRGFVTYTWFPGSGGKHAKPVIVVNSIQVNDRYITNIRTTDRSTERLLNEESLNVRFTRIGTSPRVTAPSTSHPPIYAQAGSSAFATGG